MQSQRAGHNLVTKELSPRFLWSEQALPTPLLRRAAPLSCCGGCGAWREPRCHGRDIERPSPPWWALGPRPVPLSSIPGGPGSLRRAAPPLVPKTFLGGRWGCRVGGAQSKDEDWSRDLRGAAPTRLPGPRAALGLPGWEGGLGTHLRVHLGGGGESKQCRVLARFWQNRYACLPHARYAPTPNPATPLPPHVTPPHPPPATHTPSPFPGAALGTSPSNRAQLLQARPL